MTKYTSESMVKPSEWDTQSSPTTAYHHTNIREEIRISEVTGEEYNIYVYDVEKMTHAEYALVIGERFGQRIADLETAYSEMMFGGAQ